MQGRFWKFCDWYKGHVVGPSMVVLWLQTAEMARNCTPTWQRTIICSVFLTVFGRENFRTEMLSWNVLCQLSEISMKRDRWKSWEDETSAESFEKILVTVPFTCSSVMLNYKIRERDFEMEMKIHNLIYQNQSVPFFGWQQVLEQTNRAIFADSSIYRTCRCPKLSGQLVPV